MTEDKEKHLEDYIQCDVCYQEGFLKESSSIKLVFHLTVSQNYFEGVKSRAINFLRSDIGFLYFEA